MRLTMNPGRSAETISFLPSASVSSRIVALGRVRRRAAADQLDERHHRHRAEEVHAHEPLAARRRDGLGQAVDRDRARVRREDRAVLSPARRASTRACCFTSRSSKTASTTRSAERTRSRSSVARIAADDRVALVRIDAALRDRRARGCRQCARGRPAARARSGSYSTTCLPIAAWTWPMPWPISPAPATNTRSIGMAEE